MTRRALLGWTAAAVAAAAAVAIVVVEERKAKASSSSSGTGLIFKPSIRGAGWALQQPSGNIGQILPIHLRPTPSVTLPFSTSAPMTTSAINGAVVAVTVPARYAVTQISALSTPSPIGASPTIPAGLDTGQGGTVYVTLTGNAGDVIFTGVDPNGQGFSADLHLVGFGKP